MSGVCLARMRPVNINGNRVIRSSVFISLDLRFFSLIKSDNGGLVAVFISKLYRGKLGISRDGKEDGRASINGREAGLVPGWKIKILVGRIPVDAVSDFGQSPTIGEQV